MVFYAQAGTGNRGRDDVLGAREVVLSCDEPGSICRGILQQDLLALSRDDSDDHQDHQNDGGESDGELGRRTPLLVMNKAANSPGYGATVSARLMRSVRICLTSSDRMMT